MPSGGYRPGAGRPRKNQNNQKLEGRPSAKPVAAPAHVNEHGRQFMCSSTQPRSGSPRKVTSPDVMADYFAMAMKECGKEVPSADDLRAEIEDFIAARGCEGFVAPQTVTDYILNRQGFFACECMNRKIGRMTKDLKLSPYVTAGQAYYRAMQADFNIILQIINRYSAVQSEADNAFLQLLTNRGF